MIRFHLSSVMFFPDYAFRKAVSKFVKSTQEIYTKGKATFKKKKKQMKKYV